MAKSAHRAFWRIVLFLALYGMQLWVHDDGGAPHA